MKITATLLLLAVLLPAPSLSAQNLGSLFEIGGTLYYLTMPDTVDNIRDSRFSPGDLGDPQDAVLLIYSPVDQQVRIGRAGGSGQSNNLRAGVILEFDLSTISTPANTTINIPSSEVIKVEADFPILLYAYRSNHFGTAAFTPLPVEAWGREYVAASWPGGFVRNIYPADETSYNAREKRPAPALITIVAAYDRTEVSISPTDSLQGCLGCTRVTLDEGESYMVQSFVDTTLDEDDQSQIDRDSSADSIDAGRAVAYVGYRSLRLRYHGEYVDRGGARPPLSARQRSRFRPPRTGAASIARA